MLGEVVQFSQSGGRAMFGVLAAGVEARHLEPSE